MNREHDRLFAMRRTARDEVAEFVPDATPGQFASTLREQIGRPAQWEVLLRMLEIASPAQIAAIAQEDWARMLQSEDPELRTAVIRAMGKLGSEP